MEKLVKKEIIYPQLSYSIVGCAYEVCNKLGGGLLEKVYQKALAIEFQEKGLKYKKQVYYPITYKDQVVGKSFFDFLVEEKVIVEIKKDTRYSKSHIDQVSNYLKVSDLQLALLINFSGKDIQFKRILNIK